MLVVQGESDPFGMPPAGPRREVVTVAGNHGLKADLPAVGAAVRGMAAADRLMGRWRAIGVGTRTERTRRKRGSLRSGDLDGAEWISTDELEVELEELVRGGGAPRGPAAARLGGGHAWPSLG